MEGAVLRGCASNGAYIVQCCGGIMGVMIGGLQIPGNGEWEQGTICLVRILHSRLLYIVATTHFPTQSPFRPHLIHSPASRRFFRQSRQMLALFSLFDAEKGLDLFVKSRRGERPRP